jgi:hypothetical protein
MQARSIGVNNRFIDIPGFVVKQYSLGGKLVRAMAANAESLE